MPKQLHPIHLVISVLIFGAVLPALASGQSSDDPCKDGVSEQIWEDGHSPVYDDATELAGDLRDRGFVVECIRRSVAEHLFNGQKGAAWYKTDQGIFEVWFLPKGESFAALEVIEQPQENGRFSYSFQGTPQILTHMDSAKQEWFIMYGNFLFQVWGNQRLAASLNHAFKVPNSQ